MQRLVGHDRIDLGSTTHSWKGERGEIEWEVGKRYCSVVALLVAIAMALLLIPLTLPKPKSAPMSFFFCFFFKNSPFRTFKFEFVSQNLWEKFVVN